MTILDYKNKKKLQNNLFLKTNFGFTLTELLVVVAIIGILSSVVLTSLSGTRERAKDGRRISDIKQIQLALELYYDINSSYPSGIYSGQLDGFLNVSYDPNGSEYVYSQLSSGQDYALSATLQQYNVLLKEDNDTDISDTEREYNVAP